MVEGRCINNEKIQSPSEITMYKNAVDVVTQQNISSSSDDMIDTSDENLDKSIRNLNLELNPNKSCLSPFYADHRRDHHSGSRSRSHSQLRETDRQGQRGHLHSPLPLECPPPEDHATQLIQDAEHARAKMMNVQGNEISGLGQPPLIHSVLIDETFVMVAAHVDGQLRDKILQFEYVDFARLTK